MKILVFVKQVPDTENVKLDPVTGNLKREGVASMMNPLDENAIEAAVQLKNQFGGTVSALSMGPPQAVEVLRQAMARGCDDAFLLSDRAFGGADTLATSYTLAKAAEKIGAYDLLVFGRCASDGDTAQTGPAVAAHLGIPQITLANSVNVENGWVICDRERERIVEKVSAKLPAVVTVCQEANKPKLPNIMSIMRANKKPVTIWNAEDLGADPACTGAKGSPSITKTIFEPDVYKKQTVYFSGTAEEMAKQFADVLAEKGFI